MPTRENRLGADPLAWLKPSADEGGAEADSAGEGYAYRPGRAHPSDRSLERFFRAASGVPWQPIRALEHLPQPFCVTDAQGGLVFANAAFRRMWGGEGLEGVRWPDEFRPDSPGAAEARREALETGRPRRSAVRLPGEAEAEMEVECVPASLEGGGQCVFSYFRHPSREPLPATGEAASVPPPPEAVEHAAPQPETEPETGHEAEEPRDAAEDLGAALAFAEEGGRRLADSCRDYRESSQSGGLFPRPEVEAEELRQSMAASAGPLLERAGYPPKTVAVGVGADCPALPRSLAVFLDFVFFDLLCYGLERMRGKAEPGAGLEVSLNGHGHDGVRLSLLDHAGLFKKIKLHDKKEEGVARIAAEVVRRGGSALLIRDGETELRLTLPARNATRSEQ
ncbi:PAS domain-containing protein [Desulfohalovibrio reitneri]|uniref:PAS domain-containing protein n=1 Tax=Desulfohalovibrio reitneri TaxID=1307759 RepID=UPI0004A73570|nr:PAS domain-containing protein [Desulfohalovibrio reitneri]